MLTWHSRLPRRADTNRLVFFTVLNVETWEREPTRKHHFDRSSGTNVIRHWSGQRLTGANVSSTSAKSRCGRGNAGWGLAPPAYLLGVSPSNVLEEHGRAWLFIKKKSRTQILIFTIRDYICSFSHLHHENSLFHTFIVFRIFHCKVVFSFSCLYFWLLFGFFFFGRFCDWNGHWDTWLMLMITLNNSHNQHINTVLLFVIPCVMLL